MIHSNCFKGQQMGKFIYFSFRWLISSDVFNHRLMCTQVQNQRGSGCLHVVTKEWRLNWVCFFAGILKRYQQLFSSKVWADKYEWYAPWTPLEYHFVWFQSSSALTLALLQLQYKKAMGKTALIVMDTDISSEGFGQKEPSYPQRNL
jgi:hypothetical protein